MTEKKDFVIASTDLSKSCRDGGSAHIVSTTQLESRCIDCGKEFDVIDYSSLEFHSETAEKYRKGEYDRIPVRELLVLLTLNQSMSFYKGHHTDATDLRCSGIRKELRRRVDEAGIKVFELPEKE